MRERAATFSRWTEPASEAEEERYEWTRDNVREALEASQALQAYSFKVYPKGSYPNFTNVVRDSDVDIAAELTTLFQPEFAHRAKGMTMADFGITPYTGGYSLARFKDDVEQALIDHFPDGTVKRGDKAITVRESKRGLAADVVACETYRQYINPQGRYREGIMLRSDSNPGKRIVNYPEQHLAEGKAKNEETRKRYKRVVRILKHMENRMVDEGVIEPVPSFLIESAVWSTPDTTFMRSSAWEERVEAVLTYIYAGTKTDDCVGSSEWHEANGIKYLFHKDQKWTHRQANEFALAAWRYAGFSN